MSLTGLVLIAQGGDAVFILIVILFAVIGGLTQLFKKLQEAQQDPRRPRPGHRPAGARPNVPPGRDPVRAEIEQFLREAADRRGGARPQQAQRVGPPVPAGPQGLIGREIGGCEITKLIGQGGMGEVYEALHKKLRLRVAVKVLRLVDPEWVERFRREAELAVTMRHPNIVGAMDFGDDQKLRIHYIVMEFVDGQDLFQVLARRGAMRVSTVRRIITQVCYALAAARSAKIIHRDIKPGNIILDRWGTAKLADLGLAKQQTTFEEAPPSPLVTQRPGFRGDDLTQFGAAMGTLHYMSPEQARDSKSVDHRSDIYSLGCTSYHMVCGRPPFLGSSPQEILRMHANDPRPDPRLANPRVDEQLGKVIGKMMAIKADDRYQTAEEVMEAVEGLVKGELPEEMATGPLPSLASLPPLHRAVIYAEIFGRPMGNPDL